MGDHLTPDGRTTLEGYLEEVRTALRDSDLDAAEVCDDIRDHVREAVWSDSGQPAGPEEVRSVLRQLGPPTRWAPARDRVPPGRSLTWIAISIFCLTLLGLGLFPLIGPLGILAAWVAGRAALHTLERSGRDPGGLLWLILTPVLLVAVAVVLLLLVAPLPPVLEAAGRAATRTTRWAIVAGGMGTWWVLLGVMVRFFSPPLRWLIRPVPLRPRHGMVSGIAGLALVLAAGILLLI